MEEQKEEPGSLREAIGKKARRKIRARERAQNPLWRGLGTMGMVGWSVAIPTLLGTLLGVWLDSVWETSPVSWTPILLIVGLVTGVVLAWRWVEEERREIGRDGREDSD
ncbi:MAG TPA: AtpZ/AtpI family protein [Candidatus Sulfomarinibacteraceae bacterium]|nr:AtpZ/AtpI family protein [Candidatus Sulfomarinibacteraceae bacterium]